MYIPFCSNLLVAIKQELVVQIPDEDFDVDIFLANYRKVPEYRFPVPAEDAVAMYEYLLQHKKLDPSHIILVGDSAGGGLVLSTLLRVRDGKSSFKPRLPLPLAAIVACPLADLTGDEDRIKGQHCVLSPSIIAASVNSYHPTHEDASTWADASPVHCNLSGLPPVLLQAASLDYLFGHSVRLAAKAKADGVSNWDFDFHEGVTHVFMVFPGYILPYARVGVQRMAEFAAKQFLRGNSTSEDHREEIKAIGEPQTTRSSSNHLPSAAA
ncbi:putative carbohydrate esterase [Phytophthora cinnamomi]|uniref:putative carbohydrate esterase n=1 Tax=Phytophthora cinnamomi TaxID=4785 RepID=UPI003559BFBB|nr:putative carbohydrate esterase [Phytophthora cinnamomi]